VIASRVTSDPGNPLADGTDKGTFWYTGPFRVEARGLVQPVSLSGAGGG
jgi:hypothetical protein